MAVMSPNASVYADSKGECYNFPKLQGVILASNSTFNVSILTDGYSKALLPINDKPLVWHSTNLLMENGITDIIIVVEMEYKKDVEEVLKGFGASIALRVVALEDKISGSLSALKSLREYITSDFIVIPCDLYGKVDIRGLVKSHYHLESGCTMLLYQNSKDTNNNSYRCLAVLDESSRKVISLVDSMSFNAGNKLGIYKWHVFNHPSCTIRSDMVDLHVYMFSEAMFPREDLDYFSIRFHYIPYLTRVQEMPLSKSFICGIKSAPAGVDAKEASNLGGMNEFPEGKNKMENCENLLGKSNTSVNYFIQVASGKDECLRVNRPEAFVSVNLRHSTKRAIEKVSFKDCRIAEGVKFLGTANIRKSVIMENVTIGNNVTLKGCLVCSNAVIGDNCQLNDCQIKHCCSVEQGTVATKQSFPAEDCTL